jgi:hypothetical protein
MSFATRGDTCEVCPASTGGLFEQPSFYAILLFVPLALYALYRFSSSDWRPSSRAGVECIVCSGSLSGGSDAAKVASEAWAKRLAAHLNVADAEIRVDHAGTMLQPGDDVRIEGLQQTVRHHCKQTELSHFNGLVGTVMEPQQDGDVTVRVSVRGQAGQWDLQVEALTLQPLFVDTPRDAPAVCFCITSEWASSPDFAASVIQALAMRSGVEDLLGDGVQEAVAGANAAVLSGLATGAVFVLCGDSVESQVGFKSVEEMLALASEQIVRADEDGSTADDAEQAARALNDLERFLSTHRKDADHLQQQELLREAIDTRATVQGVLSDRNAQQIAVHIGTLVRIVAMQVQQCFAFISFNWPWPGLLVELRRWVGSWVMLDFPALTNADCLAGGGRDSLILLALGIPAGLLLVLCCTCCIASYKRRKYKKSDDAAAAATAAHMANFGWAVFTLGSPAAVSGLVSLLDDEGVSAPLADILSISSPFWLFIPLLAVIQLRKAKAAGILLSRSFEARYGWLCSRCDAKAFS